MATYVFSDVHGHLRALDALMSRVSPSQDDKLFMLGDMVDRGPDSVGCLRFVRDLPNCTTLKGNHEDMMLRAFAGEVGFAFDWARNGGNITYDQLFELPVDEKNSLLEWVEHLPLYACASTDERPYILTHAGINPMRIHTKEHHNNQVLMQLMEEQSPDDLMWIRHEFWTQATRLLDENKEGPVVVAGHTPTLYVEELMRATNPGLLEEGASLDDQHRCVMLFLPRFEADGAVSGGVGELIEAGKEHEGKEHEPTAPVLEKIAIDCAAAAGAGLGQVGMLRLDDLAVYYEPIKEGE